MRNIKDRNMKIALLLISILILFSSCKDTFKQNKIQEVQVYSLINDYITDSLYHTNLIAEEATKFWNMDVDTIGPPRGPECYCTYDNSLLDTLSKFVDKNDLVHFKTQMIGNKPSLWDSSKLEMKVFSREQTDQFYQKDHGFMIYDYLKEKYKTGGFIILSTPIFSLDKNVILISVSIFPGGAGGHGEIFLFKRLNNNWIILYREKTWIS
jgi:hypothetical protein